MPRIHIQGILKVFRLPAAIKSEFSRFHHIWVILSKSEKWLPDVVRRPVVSGRAREGRWLDLEQIALVHSLRGGTWLLLENREFWISLVAM